MTEKTKETPKDEKPSVEEQMKRLTNENALLKQEIQRLNTICLNLEVTVRTLTGMVAPSQLQIATNSPLQ